MLGKGLRGRHQDDSPFEEGPPLLRESEELAAPGPSRPPRSDLLRLKVVLGEFGARPDHGDASPRVQRGVSPALDWQPGLQGVHGELSAAFEGEDGPHQGRPHLRRVEHEHGQPPERPEVTGHGGLLPAPLQVDRGRDYPASAVDLGQQPRLGPRRVLHQQWRPSCSAGIGVVLLIVALLVLVFVVAVAAALCAAVVDRGARVAPQGQGGEQPQTGGQRGVVGRAVAQVDPGDQELHGARLHQLARNGKGFQQPG
mmetsp:Transcript_8689/g.29843  ORF Transcript_8689/g.29843 Transcript_8689/m.29843 type:complete len:255 (-) Transcript_8689:1572-2336(-)